MLPKVQAHIEQVRLISINKRITIVDFDLIKLPQLLDSSLAFKKENKSLCMIL